MRTSRRSVAGVMSSGRRLPDNAQTTSDTATASPARVVPFHGADGIGRRLEGLPSDRTKGVVDDSPHWSESRGSRVSQVRLAGGRSRRRYGPGTGRHGQRVAEERSRSLSSAAGAGRDRRRSPVAFADDRSSGTSTAVTARGSSPSMLGDWRSSSSRVALDRHVDRRRRDRDQDTSRRRSRGHRELLELHAVGVCERRSPLAPGRGGVFVSVHPCQRRRDGRGRDHARSGGAFRVVRGTPPRETTPQVLGAVASSVLVVPRQEDES